MSTDYGCAFGDASHQVNWLLTHLNPALTVSVCDDDFPLAVIPLLASALGVDQGRLYESVKRFVDREQAREAREATKAAAAAVDGAPAGPDEPPDDPARQLADEDEAGAAQLEVDEHNERVTP